MTTNNTALADEFCAWLNCAAAEVLTDGSITYHMTTDDDGAYGWQVATQDMMEEFDAWRNSDGPVTFTFGFDPA